MDTIISISKVRMKAFRIFSTGKDGLPLKLGIGPERKARNYSVT